LARFRHDSRTLFAAVTEETDQQRHRGMGGVPGFVVSNL
jgi:hypothetical protein